MIKVGDRRTAAPASFEEVEPQLREQLAREAVGAVFEDLRVGVEVEIVSESTGQSGATVPAQ